jgi:hypothetical protein
LPSARGLELTLHPAALLRAKRLLGPLCWPRTLGALHPACLFSTLKLASLLSLARLTISTLTISIL